MLVSPFPKYTAVANKDPSVGWRRAAVCVFSLCLAYVTLASLDTFKRIDDSLAELKLSTLTLTNSLKLKESLLVHPVSTIPVSGTESSASKIINPKSMALKHTPLVSPEIAKTG
jgi:hypothetical protein